MLSAMTRPNPDPTAPLWRAAQVFRLLSCIYAAGFQIAINPDLRRPLLGWVLFAVLIAWSAACALAYLRGFGRRPAWVIAEIVIVVALMWSNTVVTYGHWAAENQTWPTTLWASNPTISAAIQFGPVRGMLTGLLVMATNFAVKNYFDLNMGHNATIIIELAIGMAIGMAAQTARRAHADLQRAAQLSAAVQERERLSREVHDGAIQVLALVAKRGHEIGGATAELAELASEQERALRRWVTSTATDEYGVRTTIDLRTLLRRRESDRVSVSLPGTAVVVPRRVGAELDAAVGNALDNVAAHAGPGAHAFVLLEDLGDSVTVSVRDDGVGIADGRLDEAARQGRLGISKSLVGRLIALGGSAQLHSGPDEGTEWELCVPRAGGHDD
ncbi:ATP-binding protein [Mycobacterium montefiorense]|uniref:ATP-binding protein n=2 Tax=Mycobacterium montefiorense TaxID=154654 RepID=A0AA37UYY1_9MYCO|nr:ATP-binding protein [Mycobacterium montefiorense]GKU35069.1 ATP-binding protein [Mycobacterium montefiorense]GKU41080.1 ATP-binding protein [Mycobacterium montefiorense]GKU47191.1 ATP-binding protein [Mycobacterium montefiorense]GKU53144.1 ATP-binding protein [Mycobacterium montefiorense]